MNQSEQRKAAKAFAAFWQGKGDEVSDTQAFWLSLLRDVLDASHPEKQVQFEKRVKLENTAFIDAFIPSTRVLIEQKSIAKSLTEKIPQSDGTKLTPFEQAKRYAGELPFNEHPRWIVTCNFREFRIHDMNQPKAAPEVLLLEDLEKECHRLAFLVDSTNETVQKEADITAYALKAGELVGKLYDVLLAQYLKTRGEDQKDKPELLASLNRLCVRLVFCLYAEDAGIFGRKNQFYDYLNTRRKIGRDALKNLFRILDIPEKDRVPDEDEDLLAFPYVNGGLFADAGNDSIPRLDESIIDLLLDKASISFEWSDISPTIFGAVFESTLNQKTRREGGMHYTAITNIHRVTEPLFLNDLRSELAEIKALKTPKAIEQRCNAFRLKLSQLTFLDPACGSGNFLTQTYLDLRELENEALRLHLASRGRQGQQSFDIEGINPISVSIAQFYGIEINDFAVSVAKTALWIAESQMMRKMEDIVQAPLDFLPLKSYNNIMEGNALRMDWNSLIAKEKLHYIIGNPPFSGARKMSGKNKADLLAVFGDDWRNAGDLDFVCAWFKKAAEMMQGTAIKAGLVATNSICQGSHVANLWEPLMTQYGVHIRYAWRTFIWDSDAADKAHVYCVIVGFSHEKPRTVQVCEVGREADKTTTVSHLNGYLVEEDDIAVKPNKPLWEVPEIGMGNQPIDGGNYLFKEDEMQSFLAKEPQAEKLFRPWLGADEFINGNKRWCLWLGDLEPPDLLKLPECLKRVEAVKKFRSESKRASTKKLANRPTHFQTENMPKGSSVLIPETSSENRKYIPIGFVEPHTLCSNAVRLIPDATLYHFGVLTSIVHMAWVRAVAGRLKGDYRYSKDIVYNGFPWPEPSESQRAAIEKTAQQILDARAHYPNNSMAQLYGQHMHLFTDLVTAHEANDKAVKAAYGFAPDADEPTMVAELLRRYQAKVHEDELKLQQEAKAKKRKPRQ